MSSATDPSAVPTPGVYRISFEGSGAAYFFIFLKHVFLTLITFGLYYAWAKTERRAFIWQSLSFHGHAFRYTGTGIELFRGYVLVFLGYLAFIGLPALVSLLDEALGGFVQFALLIGLFAVAPYVIYRSRNFLYNRTTWRNIRFGLKGDPGPYAREFFVGLVLTIVTLGLYAPVNANRLHRVMMNHTRFGSLEFHYDGSDFEAWKISIKGFLLSVLTFGIFYFWYRAELERFRAAHTRIGDGAVLCSTVRGVDLFVLYLLNAFGLAFTLGLAFPWILMISLGELAKRFTVEGAIDFDAIVQRAEDEGAFSEGMADALDLDFGF